ncbi:hypothetical protein MPER_12938 [Moniliophthora perniciosa FA553]|nr:hypothetical protein MPER_12938 [Moniliophthora perniciosa FA553]
MTANLQYLKSDLSEKETSGFVEMLKALISRMLMDDKDISTITADLSSEEASKVIHALKEKADNLYSSLLSSAIKFCNKDLGADSSEIGMEEEKEYEEHEDDVKLCRAMKESIREYCKASSEAERYKHLVSVLNTILCNFRSHEFKDMITPDEMDDNELIFIANDPAVIKADVTGTERKPDIIATSLDTLNSWFSDWGQCVWTNWRSKIDKGSKPPAGLDRRWLGARQPWELKRIRLLLKTGRLRQAYSVQDLTEIAPGDDKVIKRTAEKKSNQPSNSSCTGPGKRKREPEDYIESTDSKKQKSLINDPPLRKSHASDAQFANKPPPTSDNLCSPDVQLGYYALERLRAAWNITHATGVLLQDTQLQLWYYDSQGGIHTHYIDILEQLPLFVVMVMIFQRFDSRMWGERDTQICSATHSKSYHMIEDTKRGPHFQLRGRRPFTAKVSEVPVVSAKNNPVGPKTRAQAQAEAQTEPEIKFFKGAWPEVPRGKEPVVLAEAHRRADELLDEPCKSYVKDHIPTVEAWDELPDTSTVLIRCFLGLLTENGRVQLWMVSPILEPARTLRPQAFWIALWEAIRCHYLLWCIGIAHGDISLSNIMYNTATKKCILNDYDLASLMDPGTEVPERQGYERTGTRPFMALELLGAEGVAGQTQRRYRHDLESFYWVLVWVGACVQDGKEILTERYAEMGVGTYAEVHKKKCSLLMSSGSYSTTEDYAFLYDVIGAWIAWWRTFQGNMETAVYQQRRHGIPVKEEPAEYFVNALVKTAAEAAHPVPIKLDWLSVDVPTLPEESTRSVTLCTVKASS